jgi:hypothetical protein
MNTRNGEYDAFSFEAYPAPVEASADEPQTMLADSAVSQTPDSVTEESQPAATALDEITLVESFEELAPETNAVENVNVNAVMQQARLEMEKVNPILRKGAYKDPVPAMLTTEGMIDFINQTRRIPIEAIEESLVQGSMPILLWKLREFALTGEYTKARAVEIWLNWASKISSRPKRGGKDPNVASGALFDARLTKGEVIDVKPIAKIVPEKTTASSDEPIAKRGRGRPRKVKA